MMFSRETVCLACHLVENMEYQNYTFRATSRIVEEEIKINFAYVVLVSSKVWLSLRP
jgi:hypothetical protein